MRFCSDARLKSTAAASGASVIASSIQQTGNVLGKGSSNARSSVGSDRHAAAAGNGRFSVSSSKMRFATLILTRELCSLVSDAFLDAGIEVLNYETLGTLVADLRKQVFAAIFIEDDEALVSQRIDALNAYADYLTALIAVGPGGAANMSRALLAGVDDYAVLSGGAQQLIERSLARVSSKVSRPRDLKVRIGPYTVDSSRSTLISPLGEVRLSPKELTLARVLVENKNRLVTIERLCEHLCKGNDAAARRTVKQHAHMLRKKCALAGGGGANQLRIEAVYGQGYRLSL